MQAEEASGDEDARYLLRWITRHGRREFTKSEAQHHGKRRFPRADDIDPALAELTRRGYIRPKPADAAGPGRPSSPSYEVNPAVAHTEKCTQYTQNSSPPASEPPKVGSFEDIEYTFSDFANTEKRSQYSHNSVGEPKNRNSGNIGSTLGVSKNADPVTVTI